MKEKEKEERKRESEIEEKINREGRHGTRANRSCRLYLTLQTGGRRRASSLFYCRVGREEYVWLKFQSRPSAFSAMKGGVEGKREQVNR